MSKQKEVSQLKNSTWVTKSFWKQDQITLEKWTGKSILVGNRKHIKRIELIYHIWPFNKSGMQYLGLRYDFDLTAVHLAHELQYIGCHTSNLTRRVQSIFPERPQRKPYLSLDDGSKGPRSYLNASPLISKLITEGSKRTISFVEPKANIRIAHLS